MPWKETCAMDQRVRFLADWLSGDYTKSELCRAYGISRPTGDKWIARYAAEGPEGLIERSRAPHGHANATPPSLRAMIIATKRAHPAFGPKKVMDRLRRAHPELPWPADSTAAEHLKRAGLVRARRRRRRIVPYTEPFGACAAPNESWSADFKGDFGLGDGSRCYPLTISDNFSRYLLQCRALARPNHAGVRAWFERVFREYGLPQAIRTDNGAPFASLAVGGLSRLSAWWIRLGIRPERIRPGKPAQNGRHERMHRTLKAAGGPKPAGSLSAQQRQFDAFVHEYNFERSHEALKRETPGTLYVPSPRGYPARLPPIEYESDLIVRRVRGNGEIKWAGRLLYVSEVLAHEPLGLKPLDEDRLEIRYSFHVLGVLDQRIHRIVPASSWHGQEAKKV